jgi:YD repeat-containing protein
LTGVTDALGKTMSYGYGVLNSLTSVTDRRGNGPRSSIRPWTRQFSSQ